MLKTENIAQTKNISSYLNKLWKQAGELLAALKSTGKPKFQYNGEKYYISSFCFDSMEQLEVLSQVQIFTLHQPGLQEAQPLRLRW